LEYPIYVLSGAIVPITSLPSFLRPISMILPPTWGVEALRASALPGYSTVFGPGMYGNLIVCTIGTIALYLIARWLMGRMVDNVLETGSFTRY
ncbi:MAG: hypothetical protein ACI4Q9_05415, partial [Candidatus Methanomethylophilaceae archaeon]